MKRISIFTLILTLAVTACQEGIIEQDAPLFDSEMRFNISTPGAQTKVANGAFEINDKIGLYVTDYASDNVPMPLQLSGNRANNMSLKYDGANWTPQESIYWGNGKSDIYAYYPYSSEISDVNDQYFELALDQTGKGYESSDFLWAKATGLKQTDGAVNLAMKHIMSKITVHLVAGDDYIGSLPEDASVLLHSTVTAGRIDLEKGAISKDPYSGAKSIQMRNLGVQTQNDIKMVVYEAIVIPQMLENSVPLFEINSKSVSYILEDAFKFRPGVAYTYTVTLNSSTNAIKVEIGCETEDWNNAGSGGSGDSGNTGGDGDDIDDGKAYIDLSANGTANCYLVQETGDYKFKATIGNTDANVGNVKSVEVLWESFGTDVMPNIGDIITSVSYKNGYVRFSTAAEFSDGNALIAVKNSKGVILWSWHIWCSKEGWQEHSYPNNAGTLMDRNLGATSATPGSSQAHGLLYQFGRKDPFLNSSSINSGVKALSTGAWAFSSTAYAPAGDLTPMTHYREYYNPHDFWCISKAPHDPCPNGWQVPIDTNSENIWSKADMVSIASYDSINYGFTVTLDNATAWYPLSGGYGINSPFDSLLSIGTYGYYWSVEDPNDGYGCYAGKGMTLYKTSITYSMSIIGARTVRCQKETNTNSSSNTSGNEGVDTNEGNGVWETIE